MNRKSTLLIIAGIMLIVIFKVVGAKRQHPSDSAAGTAPIARDRRPFRNAVVELTFGSKSLNQGEEVLSATGRRIEYIDAVGDRRREDYQSHVTTMRQATSTEGLTLIFDGRKLYIVRNKDGNRSASVMDLREGYDYTVWEDAAAEAFQLPGTTISEEQVLGRPCKVYTRSEGAADIQRMVGVERGNATFGVASRPRCCRPAKCMTMSWLMNARPARRRRWGGTRG